MALLLGGGQSFMALELRCFGVAELCGAVTSFDSELDLLSKIPLRSCIECLCSGSGLGGTTGAGVGLWLKSVRLMKPLRSDLAEASTLVGLLAD